MVSYVSGILVCYPNQKNLIQVWYLKKNKSYFLLEILILFLVVRVLVQMNSYVQVEIGKFYCVDQAKVCFDITKVAVWA